MFDPEKKCPLLNKKCIQHRCQWFTQLQGTSPQTGQPIDEWGCAIAWLPTLLIEGSKETRQTAAAIESFRNEMVRGQQTVLRLVEGKREEKITDARDDYRR